MIPSPSPGRKTGSWRQWAWFRTAQTKAGRLKARRKIPGGFELRQPAAAMHDAGATFEGRHFERSPFFEQALEAVGQAIGRSHHPGLLRPLGGAELNTFRYFKDPLACCAPRERWRHCFSELRQVYTQPNGMANLNMYLLFYIHHTKSKFMDAKKGMELSDGEAKGRKAGSTEKRGGLTRMARI